MRCQPCLQPEKAANFPPALWKKIFDHNDRAFFPEGHPAINMTGHCKCDKLQFRVDGSLTASFMCHCAMCRKYWAQDVPTHCLWIKDENALTVTQGQELLKSWTVERLSRNLRGQATVFFCGNCGTPTNVKFSDPNAGFTLMWPYNFHLDEWYAKTDYKDAGGKNPWRHGSAATHPILRPRFHAHYENRAADVEDSLPKLADIWFEGTPLMNNKGEVVGKVTFPMPTAYPYWPASDKARAEGTLALAPASSSRGAPNKEELRAKL